MNDLQCLQNRDCFYHTSHHIKKLLRRLQQADTVEEVHEIEMLIHLNVDIICENKADDINKFNEHRERLLTELLKWGVSDGKARLLEP